MPIEILMPALSPTMKEGNLAKWVKKEGDRIKAGEVIAEIETDKATMEVEAVDEGILGKILVADGTENVAVNSCIALILEDGEDKKLLENYEKKSTAPKKIEAKKEEKTAPSLTTYDLRLAKPKKPARSQKESPKNPTFLSLEFPVPVLMVASSKKMFWDLRTAALQDLARFSAIRKNFTPLKITTSAKSLPKDFWNQNKMFHIFIFLASSRLTSFSSFVQP